MLEAQAHTHLKTLLRQGESNWPHHLTLSRLVGRSLRRGDGPCCAWHRTNGNVGGWVADAAVSQPSSAVLVLTAQQRQRLLRWNALASQDRGSDWPAGRATPPRRRINSGCWTMPA